MNQLINKVKMLEFPKFVEKDEDGGHYETTPPNIRSRVRSYENHMEIRPYQYQRSDAAPNQNYLLEPENDPDPAQTPGNKKGHHL